MESAIKSGRLNLLYSYRYKAIHEYLIDESLWKTQRDSLLEEAGLVDFIIEKQLNKVSLSLLYTKNNI
ncbi:hypothetical protein AYO45_01805 [Gammaproteobacteria bacterium SCGC AG-212-F23]|nr:hypothetical protein AYO45_01805 [Gammaproteobacteria bacterium SCGC AG-212-F23]